MKSIRVEYYAMLREQSGCSEEQIETAVVTAADLFRELSERHRFDVVRDALKVAINEEFCSWETELQDGDTFVMIPPVAGG